MKRRPLMKFLHIADLHLGKRVNEYSMLDEQRAVLEQIVDITKKEKPHAVFIAGDVYDKLTPPAEAVMLLDSFLCSLARCGTEVFLISGNHDSPERLAFGSALMEGSGVHIAPVYDGTLSKHTVKDEYGEVDVYMLPFIRPSNVKRFFEDKEILSYTDAVNTAIDAANIDFDGRRTVLLSHQFVTGGTTCESEVFAVGGLDNVDADAYDGFDYVALGHLHGQQKIVDGRIYYSGTPLKYSFSEKDHKKGVLLGEMDGDGGVKTTLIPLIPLHDMRELKMTFNEAIEHPSDDYMHIILTDEVPVPFAHSKLLSYFPNLMNTDYETGSKEEDDILLAEHKYTSPSEIFEELFEKINGRPMTDEQRKISDELIKKIWEEEVL